MPSPLVEAQARIRATIWQALLYPSALSAMMVFLLCIVAHRMVPSLARLSDPVTDRPARHAQRHCQLRHRTGIYVLVAVITLTVVVIVTLPTYRWKGRVWLDRTLPPWSIYRMLQGTTFLLNMAVMLNAGIRPYDSLASMIKISPPWLKQRLEAARRRAWARTWESPFAAPVTISPTDRPSSTCASSPTGRLLRSAGQVQPPLAGDQPQADRAGRRAGEELRP